MIIVRSPLRITLGGGGTDLPYYYRNHGGFTLSAAIDKYVYVTVTRPFFPGIYLKYSELEHVESVRQIKHSRIKAALKEFSIDRIEITTLTDIPAGTGLGSSSSFTTALLKALCIYDQWSNTYPEELARLACRVEMDRLQEPIGKQDQYISAYGGIQSIAYNRDESIMLTPLRIKPEVRDELEDNLLLFFTGITRSTTEVMKPIPKSILDSAYKQGKVAQSLLETDKLNTFALLLNDQWALKREYQPNYPIDSLIMRGLDNGAIGGKLVGAGGGGFLLFYAEDKTRLRTAMREAGLEEVRFRFEYEGTKALLV